MKRSKFLNAVFAEPAHGRAANPRYLQLLAALDEGWQVAPPVYHRPRWLDTNEQVYHFILKHPEHNGTRLITVSEDPEVERFVRSNALCMLRLRHSMC